MFRSLARLAAAAVLFAGLGAGGRADAQQVPVTFRFIPDLTPPAPTVVRAFLAGGFNDWGQPYGAAGQIQAGDESQMTYSPALAEYRYTISLPVGQSSYKIQYHRNAAGTDYVWLADPLVSEVTGPNDDSVVRVTDPMAFQLAREQNTAGQVEAVSAGVFGTQPIASVTFTVNATTYTTGITDTGNGVYRLVLPAPVPVGSLFRVDAVDTAGRTATATVGSIPPTVVDAPVPAGLPDGITYDPSDPTRVTLVLRAPRNQYVAVRGGFNGWQINGAPLLSRDTSDPRGTRWWITLTGLTPGQDVAFQYLVDGTIQVTDPYAARVLYPGQAGFPTGQTTFPVGILHPGAAPFPWTDAGFQAPATADLVIYELNLRDFLADDRFATLADTLDYLVRLGVNAIELMPVSQRDAADSWGYDPGFHFAVENRYGRPEDLKAFVDAAHARGLAVLLDVVYNHATSQSPLVRLDNTGETGPPTATNSWANPTARHDFNVFNDLNHESPLTQLWLDRANRWWIEEYHVDGYRFDFTSGFMQTGPFYQFNQSRIDLLTRMIGALREVHPNTIITMEHLTPIEEVRAVTQFGEARGWPSSLSWVLISEGYRLAASGFPTVPNSTFQGTYTPTIGSGLPVRNGIAYMESHDEQWMMYANRVTGNSSGTYNIRDLYTALDRQKEAAAFFFTVPGARMMWQFGELGYGGGPGECLVNANVTCPAGTPNRIASKPIRWDYFVPGVTPVRGSYTGPLPLTPATDTERAARVRLYKTFQALIGLRNDYAIFRSPATQVQAALGAQQVRTLSLSFPGAPAGQPTRAFVFGNFGVTPANLTLSSSAPTTWYDFFGDTEATFPAGPQTLTLAPGEFHVWTDVDVPSPEPGLITADEGGPGAPGELALGAFPNPTASGAVVRYTLAAAADVRLDVYDVLGRRVATLAEGLEAAGTHEASLDASALPAGVYVLRLAAGEQSATARVTVAR
jgi:glycosidase